MLNTCAIRENADNRLYGNLGHLKPLKDTRPDAPDRGRGVPGAEGPGRDPAARRRGSTSWSARTRCRICSSCWTRRRARRARRWTCASTRRSSRARCRPRGHDAVPGVGVRSRRGATTPARSASCRSSVARSDRARSGDILAEVQGLARARRRRGHAARAEREHVRPRRHGAGLVAPAALRGAAAAVGAVDGHPAGAVHVAAPARLHPGRDRGDGRDARRSASTSTSRCNRAPTVS